MQTFFWCKFLRKKDIYKNSLRVSYWNLQQFLFFSSYYNHNSLSYIFESHMRVWNFYFRCEYSCHYSSWCTYKGKLCPPKKTANIASGGPLMALFVCPVFLYAETHPLYDLVYLRFFGVLLFGNLHNFHLEKILKCPWVIEPGVIVTTVYLFTGVIVVKCVTLDPLVYNISDRF